MHCFLFILSLALALFSANAAERVTLRNSGTRNAVITNAVASTNVAPHAPVFGLKDGDRVVFLGDTFIEREQLDSYIETMLTLRFPTNKIIFRNIGWSADTPLGESRAGFDAPEKGFDRLKEHLAAVKPTVVFLSHGMANSFAGQAGLLRFEADMRTLVKAIEEVAGKDVRLVFLGPIAHEKLPPPLPDPKAHNEQLRSYGEALRKLAAEKNAIYVNLAADMSAAVDGTANPTFTDNGIHLTPFGYWRIAKTIEAGLVLSRTWRLEATVSGEPRSRSTPVRISSLAKSREGARFDVEETALVLPPSPEPKAQESLAADAPRLAVVGLSNGEYALRIDGAAVAVKPSADWAKGVFLFHGAMFDQAEEVRKAVVKKNELYFDRWRPENETYLFGFRKHEQGQNAREIPMFDPLIAEQENKINELKKPRTLKFELVAATEQDRTRVASFGRKPALPPSSPSPAVQPLPRPTFDLGPGLEVNLFAENPDLAKPIQMNFDPQGRLWIASSSVYPQIQPGQVANDKILVLEDTNGDGVADKSSVFAEGLLIPTGVLPGDGGVYVANSTQLVFFKDTDGDGKADTKRIVLSGFGTEDTHHILHTLRWGFDGQLYMNQSIYIHSHIETPNGVVRLNSGGIWNFRPETMELGIHMKGLVNPWGHHFDKFGQSFATDGAGGEGINWVIPQAMYFTYAGARRILPSVSPGAYPKFASLEVIESEHFPADWQGTMVTCDFRAHRVVRFQVNEADSAYITKELPDVMRSTNVTFRPIDVKLGPDGALYIADWSNPIIQHGEVDFRDPRRDHEHGRIWRVTYKDRPLVKKSGAKETDYKGLLDDLLSPNNFVRARAKRILTENRHAIQPVLTRWTTEQTTEQGMLEALWMYQAIDVANPALLEKVLNARDGHTRAAGTRVLSFWRDRVQNRDELLARLIADEHPRVRMEAMRALAKVPTARSAELVLAATEKPMDKYLDYAAWLSINDLAEPWVAAIKSGEWKPAGKEKQLAFGLNALTPELAAAALPSVLPSGDLPKDGSGPWIELIGKSGGAKELSRLLDQTVAGGFDESASARAFGALAEAARLRNARPDGDLARVEKALANKSDRVRVEATKLAGALKVASLSPKLLEIARAKETPAPVRQAAFQSIRDIGGSSAVSGLTELAGANSDLAVRQQAVVALAGVNLKDAVPLAIETLIVTTNDNQALALWRQLLANKGAAPIFAQALPKSGLPAVMAKTGLRVAREGGRNEPNLVLALARNIENEEEAKNLTPEELKELIANVTKNGDPARGEMIYRKQELGCMTCHAIGGVGGKVGPDLTSIGASAQIDYLIESIQFPNRKVKEGYHSTTIETKDDQEISGILVRDTAEEVIVRDSTGKEISIAKNNISKRRTGGSLMPAGLVDALSQGDQVDLYRFLSELGKPGRYDASKAEVARYYKILAGTIDLAQFGDDKIIGRPLTDAAWNPAIPLIDGALPQTDLQRQVNRTGNRTVPVVYTATQFSAPKEGAVHLKIEKATPMAVYIDGELVKNVLEPTAELKPGQHVLVIKLDATHLPEGMRVRSSEVTFGAQ